MDHPDARPVARLALADYDETVRQVAAHAASVRLDRLAFTDQSELLLEGHILLACVDAKNRPRGLPEDVVRTLFLPEISQSDDLVIPGSRADRAGNA